MKKSISLFLVLVMMISILPKYSFAVNFSDMPDDWSKTALENAVANGLLNGSNGKIMPKEDLTRAQLAAIVNRAFGATEKASLGGITDVAANAWHYADMAKAVHMGTMIGNGFKLNPDSKITREEAFVVLARAFKLTNSPESAIDKFTDRALVSGWAKDGVASLVEAGHIAGSNGELNPKEKITRAEFAQMMNNLLVKYIQSAGVNSTSVNGNVMINTPGVTLKNMVITGDLIIGDGVGNGFVTLDGVTVSGRTVIRGGGLNPVKIIGNSNLEQIVIVRVNGVVRVNSEAGSRIGSIIVDGCDEVIIEGSVGTVFSVADDVMITVTNADISLITIEGYDSQIIVDAHSSVEKIIISADSTAVAVSEGSMIKHIEVNGDDAIVGGAGDVGSVAANRDGAYVSTLGTSITAAAGTTGTSTGTKEVIAGTTVVIPEAIGLVPTPTEGPTPLSTQIPSTGGGGPVTVEVGAIAITGNNTAVNGQTLQLGATVTPDNAANKTVTWSVASLAGGTASISAGGLLTATGVGTVTVTAKDISSKVVENKDITITNGEQLAPTGLSGIAPTTFGGIDGKITGTTIMMEYKLAADDVSTYAACSVDSTTVAVAGKYVIRFIAKPGYNAGDEAAVTVKEAIIATIAGVAAPTMGGTPVTAITDTIQYSGNITWSPIEADTKFTSGKEYSATITLSAKEGQDMGEVAANYFKVPGARATNAAGSGVITAVFPTMVASPADLEAISTNLDGDYIQVANISLTGINWVPIGTISMPFKGKYDGNGMSVDKLTIRRDANNAGLFGDSLNAVFLDITLQNVDIRAYGFVGGLIGYSEGSNVTNCSVVNGSVTGSDFGIGGIIGISYNSIINASHAGCNVTGGVDIGGLIGMLGGNSSIINSYATGNITGMGYVGGLIGQIESAYNTFITGCHATGLVIASDASNYYAGGLVGLVNGNTVISSSYATGNVSGHKSVGGLVGRATKIINCYALGNVTGTDKLGGLAGQNNGPIENCFSAGKVTGTGDNCGGLIGFYNDTYVPSNSYYDKNISDSPIKVNGLPRSTLQMKIGIENSRLNESGLSGDENIYTGWDNLIWKYGTDLEYPSLK